MASVSALSSSNRCPKCGTTKKSGKHSCCARGGAWFKNCGDAGDKKFGHTWAEGTQVCKALGGSASVEWPLRVMFNHAGVTKYPRHTVRRRNSTQHQENMSRVDALFDAGTTVYNDCGGVVQGVVWIFVLFILCPCTYCSGFCLLVGKDHHSLCGYDKQYEIHRYCVRKTKS